MNGMITFQHPTVWLQQADKLEHGIEHRLKLPFPFGKILPEAHFLPDIQITHFDRDGDRGLRVQHRRHRGRPLNEDATRVLGYLQRLWGFRVRLDTVDESGSIVHYEEAKPG